MVNHDLDRYMAIPGIAVRQICADFDRHPQSPLGWEHINLTGDYVWRQNRLPAEGRFRPLRMGAKP